MSINTRPMRRERISSANEDTALLVENGRVYWLCEGGWTGASGSQQSVEVKMDRYPGSVTKGMRKRRVSTYRRWEPLTNTGDILGHTSTKGVGGGGIRGR